MSVSISLNSPRAFTRESILLVAGGAASGIVASLLQLLAGEPHPELSALSLGAILGLLANLSDSREGTPMYRLVLALLGGVVMALLTSVNPIAAAAAGGAFIGGALTVGGKFEGFEKLGVWMVYAVALGVAAFVAGVLVPQFFAAGLLGNFFQGGIWGLFLAFAAGLSHLDWSRDEILSEFREAEADLKGASKENMKNGRQLYEQIVVELARATELETQNRAREIATETARALITLARRSDELRVASEVKLQRHLSTRVVELDEKVRAEKDATVRKELQATLDELIEQVRVRKRLQVARARIEAREQRCFTALERLHVALIQGGAGQHASSALEESIGSLEKLSDEIHWRNLSVDELCEGADVESPEEVVAELKAEHADGEDGVADLPSESVEGEVLLDHTSADETRTVLDTASLTDEPDSTEDTDGTDGTIGVVEEAHVESTHSS